MHKLSKLLTQFYKKKHKLDMYDSENLKLSYGFVKVYIHAVANYDCRGIV